MATFKILLGKSEDGSEHPSLADWRKKVDRKIEVHQNAEGALYYLIGDFTSPHSASEYFLQLKSKGLEPIDFYPLIRGQAIPKGWEGETQIGLKQTEIAPIG